MQKNGEQIYITHFPTKKILEQILISIIKRTTDNSSCILIALTQKLLVFISDKLKSNQLGVLSKWKKKGFDQTHFWALLMFYDLKKTSNNHSKYMDIWLVIKKWNPHSSKTHCTKKIVCVYTTKKLE